METLTLEQPRALVELELTPSPLCDRADHRIVVGSKEYSGAGSFTVMCEGKYLRDPHLSLIHI